MDATDKEILKNIQEDFPLAETPFADVARRLDLSETELISRIAALKEAGVIRRVGAVLDAKSLGVATVLCAARVDQERIEEVAGIVSSFRQVTHNYQRDGDYNLWFTVWGKDEQDLERTVGEIEAQAAVWVTRLPAVKTYKIRAVFDLT
ncbi:MAG: Lrp/AsnC family transcriptional regulator [Deltaproteobacteria bacterium]|nr:Lrp/AsnC family transcriptional regulator [Candidatus Zymogenaceae bacterium]